MITVIMAFAGMMIEGRVKQQSIAEVEGQGSQIVEYMSQIIRNAKSITSPITGGSGSTLVLEVYDGAKSPTVFDLSTGTIRITEGSNSPIALSSSLVDATNLSFSNTTLGSTSGTIKIQFDLARINNSGRNEYEYNQTFYGAATVRGKSASGIVTSTPSDTTPPSAISDFAASNPSQTSIDLAWTSPGDDAGVGTAAAYDIRYSTSLISEANWASATQVIGEPVPSIAGSSESVTVSSLTANTTYYFAIKTSDEVPNTSAISNIPSATTLALGTEASNLVVDTTSVVVGGGSKTLQGITLENTGASNITITEMTVSWTGGASGNKMKTITIDGTQVFSGNSNSGSITNITDTLLATGGGVIPLDSITFSKNIPGTTFDILFTMSDASTKNVTGITP